MSVVMKVSADLFLNSSIDCSFIASNGLFNNSSVSLVTQSCSPSPENVFGVKIISLWVCFVAV